MRRSLSNWLGPWASSKSKSVPTRQSPGGRIQIEPGQTAWEALLQIVEANGLYPWVEPDSCLNIGGTDYNAAPVKTLILSEDGAGNTVQRLSVRRSIANQYSQITVLGLHGQYDYDGLDTKRSLLRSVIQDETLARR